MRSLYLLLCSIVCCAEEHFQGVLDPSPYPSSEAIQEPLLPATAEQRARLRDWVWPSERVWAGDVRGAFALVLDRMDGKRALYVDRDKDFILTPAELVREDVLLLGGYPVRVTLKDNQLRQSARALVRGRVRVEGRDVAVEYEIDRVTGLPSITHGLHCIGGARALATGKAPVFAAGDVYVSTSTIDVRAGKVILRSHPSSDYPVIDVKPGRLFPDFRFVDTSERTRTLQEFRGRYVLLDFWASWCPPCRSDFQHLAAAYERYRPNLEIIGMNGDTEPAQAASLLAEQRPAWTQAVSTSIRDLLDNRLRLYRYPAYVLLDKEGRVLWVLTGELGPARLGRILQKYLKP